MMPYHARDALSMVRIYKLFHDFGCRDRLPKDNLVDEDYYWSLIHEALVSITDYVNIRDMNDDFRHWFYYQDPAMREYYRLSDEYDRLRGAGTKSGLYRVKADQFVENALGSVYDVVDYTLQTRLNHKWSCRLIIEYDGEYFHEYEDLLGALLRIFDFYRRESEALRAELTRIGGETADKKEAA